MPTLKKRRSRHRNPSWRTITEPSPAQLAIRQGDTVDVVRDNGTVTQGRVYLCDPYKTDSGDWVAHVDTISGYYALCRMRKVEVVHAG